MDENLTPEIRKYFSELGKKGGSKTLALRGKDYFKEIRKKRKTWNKWGKKIK